MHSIAATSAPILHPTSLCQGEPFWPRRGEGHTCKKGIADSVGCRCSCISSGRNAKQRAFGKEIFGTNGLASFQPRAEPLVHKAGEWRLVAHASLMADPAIWVIRTAVFYVLLETGVAARSRPRQDSGEEVSGDKGSFAIFEKLFGPKEQKRVKELAKVRRQWHASTKGTLVRKYRVPSKAGGRKLLVAISSLLADDDTFRDVATSKGCQIRRENAHAESVCCHNVRALFDELPTPHLVLEITVFPAGPITEAHYEKAEKLEKVLRTGASI